MGREYILSMTSDDGSVRYLKEFEISSKRISQEWSSNIEDADKFDTRQLANGVKTCLQDEESFISVMEAC